MHVQLTVCAYSSLFTFCSGSLLAYLSPGGNKSSRQNRVLRLSDDNAALHWCKEQHSCCPAKWTNQFVAIGHFCLRFFYTQILYVSDLLPFFFKSYTTFHFYILTLMLYFIKVRWPGGRKMDWGYGVLVTTTSHNFCGTLLKLCLAHCWPTHPPTSQWKKTPDGQSACVIQTGVNILVLLHA